MYFKIIILVTLALILLSLGSGVAFLYKDSGSSKRLVTSLTIRVILSITLFALIIFGYLTGQIQPHGI